MRLAATLTFRVDPARQIKETLMSRQTITLIVVAVFVGIQGRALAGEPCESLAALKLPNTTITLAQAVAAGAFVPPGLPGAPPPNFKSLPAFCRVAAVVKPTKESDIRIEVWMPANGWNGRLRSVGNGGFAGAISYEFMAQELSQLGYATASTDTGHASPRATDAGWALGHPEKVTDYGYRAIHEMTRFAKATIRAFYGTAPRYSYFGSCSNGGRQALMEAQRYPQDYDGIVAGAPSNFGTHILTWTNALTPALDHGGYIPATKLPAIARAVNAACDARDGVEDGILNDPRTCHFDPATLLCTNGDSSQCLTAPQVSVLKALYAGPHDSKGRALYPGFLPGAEEGPSGWGLWITGPAPGKSLMFDFSRGFFSDMVYGKPNWDLKDNTVDEAVAAADAKIAKILNATDSNLSAFKARGGKLILYHGWNDPALASLNTINYYRSVERRLGARETAAFTRLYMVPGMQHCDGGPGPHDFGQPGKDSTGHVKPRDNIKLALQQWVEKGIAPTSIVATKYVDDDPTKGVKMTRPLCPYPQAAMWTGKGSTGDAANFVCKAP
jgi:hypothetical protein